VEKVTCNTCGWKGNDDELGKCRIGHHGTDDSEVVERCPNCGSMDLNYEPNTERTDT